MSYRITVGHKADMWFITRDNLILWICYSEDAAKEMLAIMKQRRINDAEYATSN